MRSRYSLVKTLACPGEQSICVGSPPLDMICEAAVDTGEIKAGDRSEPICELELELLEGDSEPLLLLGEEMKARHGLVAGQKSKFARGKALRVEK